MGFTVPTAEMGMWVGNGNPPVWGKLRLDTAFPAASKEGLLWVTQRAPRIILREVSLLHNFLNKAYYYLIALLIRIKVHTETPLCHDKWSFL